MTGEINSEFQYCTKCGIVIAEYERAVMYSGQIFCGDCYKKAMKAYTQENNMNHTDFDSLVEQETKRMKDVMCSKSADYSAADDKLFNFKLAAEVDGVTPIEALRGMWLKHRTSIRQGLDELMAGKCRPEKWWTEKLTDDRNYSILLQALLIEKYFKFVCLAGWVIARNLLHGWYVCHPNFNLHHNEYLRKDGLLHHSTGCDTEAPGYWPTKEAAKDALVAYLRKEQK